jgi:hypothetical protein
MRSLLPDAAFLNATNSSPTQHEENPHLNNIRKYYIQLEEG